MKTIKYFIQAIVIYTFFLLVKIIGLNSGRKLSVFIFNKIGPLIKSKNIVNKNLENILKNNDKKIKQEIIYKMWSNYAMTFVEYLYLDKFRNRYFENNKIKIKGQNILDQIKEKNKPVIFISGHFANFELMSMYLGKNNIKLATIYRPLNNFFINPFMEFVRRNYVCKNQIKKGLTGMRQVVEYLKKSHSIALMVDQRVSEGKNLPFFGKNALTTTLPAQLALKYKFDIVPLYISRNKDNIFEIEVFDPIKTLGIENTEKNKIKISLNINKIIEKMILRDPSQWIWTHNRWK